MGKNRFSRARLLAIILLTFMTFVPACTAEQSSPVGSLRVIRSDAKVSFPAAIAFYFEAEGPANIRKIILEYKVKKIERIPVISVVSPKFEPADRVSTQWVWQMKKSGGLPPGSEIEYRWKIEDIEHNKLETPLKTVTFDDGRFTWKEPLIVDRFSIFYYQGDSAFGQELANGARRGMDKLSGDIGVALQYPGKLYIYANARDLQSALIFPQEWTGGVAFREYNMIALAIGPTDLAWGKRAIAHELTHLAVFQKTMDAFGNLPTWFNEGLATYGEGEMEPFNKTLLDRAAAQNRLISIKSLSSPFPTNPDEARLSYAESASIIEFMIKTYGKDKILQLLNALGEGANFNESFNKLYGFSADDLDVKWRNSLGVPGRPAPSALRATSLVRYNIMYENIPIPGILMSFPRTRESSRHAYGRFLLPQE